MSLSFKRNYSVFSPKDFGPALWLDGADSSTMYDATVGGNVVTNNTAVARWEDKSGNNRHATQGALANRPLYLTNIQEGKSVVRFDGSNDFISYDGSFFVGSEYTIIAAVSRRSNKVANYIMGGSGGSAQNVNLHFGWRAETVFTLAHYSNDLDGSVSPYKMPLFEVFSGSLNTTTGRTLFSNGNLIASHANASTMVSYNGACIGALLNLGGHLNGDVAEIIVYPRALTQFERQVVEGYLSVKWGIPVSSSLAPSIRVGQSFDSDASAYFSRIVSAGSSITRENMVAIDQFIRGCKTDGIWNAIKACCILAGADTLAGALVPLVGPAPTNIGFVEGDYSRTTGLKGNVSKLLDSNRNNNEDPQNSHHLAAWVTQEDTTSGANPGLIGTGGSGDGDSGIIYSTSGLNYSFRSRHVTPIFGSSVPRTTGLHAISRYSANNVAVLLAGFTSPVSRTSQTPRSSTIKVFGRDGGPYWNGRVSFYSIGVNINLTALNNRLATLMSSLT